MNATPASRKTVGRPDGKLAGQLASWHRPCQRGCQLGYQLDVQPEAPPAAPPATARNSLQQTPHQHSLARRIEQFACTRRNPQ
jgi:hypothetical protein